MPLTDDDLRRSAYRLSGAMLQMLRADGLDVDIVGVPDQEDSDPYARSIEIDAEQYMSMNPARLTEEFDEIRDAALATWQDADPNGVVGAMRADIEVAWHGEASIAFGRQLHKIERCIETQYEYTLLAAQAVGMMYAVNAQFRASCQDLMERTADTCEAVTANSGESPGFEWASVATSLVKAAIDTFKEMDPGKVRDWAVDQILGGVTAALKPKPVEGAEAIPVVTGYTSARDRLFGAYEDNLDQIREWVAARRDELAGLAETIPEPVPSSADVGSPDFTYENFAYVYSDQDPTVFAPEVERERQRHVEEKAKPDGVIARRLDGDR